MPTKPRPPSTDRQTLRDFWHAAKKYRHLVLLSLLFPTGLLLSNVVAPLFISKALGSLVTVAGRAGHQPQHYLYIFMATAAIGLLFNRVGHPAYMRLQALVPRDLGARALSTLLKRGVSFHNDNVGGKLVSDALDYPDAYIKLVDTVYGGLLPITITFVAGSLILYPESWVLGLYVTVVAIIVVGLGLRDSRRMAPRRRKRLAAEKASTAHFADAITNIQTVKTFSREQDEFDRHWKLSDKVSAIRQVDWTEMSLRGNNRLIILAILQAALVAGIITLVQRDPSLLGAGIFAFTFTMTLYNRLFEINMLIRNLEDSLLKASSMTEIIAQDVEVLDKPDAKELQIEEGRVSFSHVSFGYTDGHSADAVFKDLDLRVAGGEKVGLVGPSGGGKSTLTRLLLRFEDVTAGSIDIDGQDIAAVTQSSLRQSISYVPQEPLLFHRSIRENIAYGKPHASLDDIRRAAELAHADEFIAALREGYDTTVGERGVKLSGGQRQRIAIARALLKDAPILVLDEATSALDSESELLIQDALWKLMEKRTAIVVAHRLSTIQKMDRIVVLDGGKIVEQGSHDQLLKHKGLYASLWSHQSGGFLKERDQAA